MARPFERLKSITRKMKFYSSNDPTHADLFLYSVLEANIRLSPDCLKIIRTGLFKEVVEAIPSVSEYIKSARRLHVNGSAFLDNPKNPIDNNDEEKMNCKKTLYNLI